jgi:hypothetical protein
MSPGGRSSRRVTGSSRCAADCQVAAAARAEGLAIVTEKVADLAADLAAEHDVVLGFVLKKNLPAGRAQAGALAAVTDRWEQEHPDPPRQLAEGCYTERVDRCPLVPKRGEHSPPCPSVWR